MLQNKIQKLRINILIGLVILIGVVVVVQLFFLQVIDAGEYKERAKNQYVTPVGDNFDRGNIYFTKKDGSTFAAATVMNGFKVAIVPNLISDPQALYDQISEIINVERDDFFAKAVKKNDPYEEVSEKITQDQANALTALNLKGLSLSQQKWRFYPGDELAAKTIGFVSYKKDRLSGTSGLEAYYEDVLARDEDNLYINFFAAVFANMKSSVFKNDASTGDIITSIEPTVQSELEKTISDIQEKWNSDSVGGVIMDPHTGEIIAIAAVPTFNLNEYGSVKNSSLYNNPFAQSRYEMGSIVKPLIMAAAIDSGAVTPSTKYNDQGSVTINGTTLSNFDKVGRGTVNMQEVLSQSLNTGMIFVQQQMGKADFKNFLANKYKLGSKTGIDLPGEVNGSVSSLNGQNDINYAAASFGQGIATSPLNIVRGFAVLANGGVMVTPHIVTKIIDSNGKITQIEHIQEEPILKPETISTIGNMLTKVVDDGYHMGLEHYSVAAKTGTAQIARSDGGGYYTDRNLHSFIGFFPVNKPRYVLYLFNVYPKNVRYAIQSLGEPFFDMVKFMNNYYDIPPDR